MKRLGRSREGTETSSIVHTVLPSHVRYAPLAQKGEVSKHAFQALHTVGSTMIMKYLNFIAQRIA